MAASALKNNAALLTIGSELLSGKTVNTNAAFLGTELFKLGFSVTHQESCPDDLPSIQSALCRLESFSLLIVTGGLGPTPDDVTRDALAAHFSSPLKFHPQQFRAMQRIYKKLGRKMPAMCRAEATYPANAHPLLNRFGIALGFWIEDKNRIIVVLPGVPSELHKMFEHDVTPLLNRKFGKLKRMPSLLVRMAGISEPRVMENLRPDFFDVPFQFGIYPSEGEVQIALRAGSKKTISRLRKKIAQRLKKWIFSWDNLSLAETIAATLTRRKKTLAVLESCTGGSLAFAWTQNAGASTFFRGGAVVYSREAKIQIGINPRVIQKSGEVSEATARELALQAVRFWQSDYGIGITGIAGPAGGSPAKPVGLVYIAVASGQKAWVEKHLFWGNRSQIQRKAVMKAQEQLWRLL